MTVTLSIKNVPEDLAERLRVRARKNHRSLQGELMAILEGAGDDRDEERPSISLDELWERARARGISSPDEAAAMIREDRDSR